MNICLVSYSFLPRTGGMEWVVHNLANALYKAHEKINSLFLMLLMSS